MFRRKLKGMNTDAFQADPSQILTYHPHMIVSELNAHLTTLRGKHAPVTKHIRKRKKITHWLIPEILVAKRERRRAERALWRSDLTMHKDIFTQKKEAVTRLFLKAKTDYLNAQVADRQTCKQLFSVANSLLGNPKSVFFLPTFQLLSFSISLC